MGNRGARDAAKLGVAARLFDGAAIFWGPCWWFPLMPHCPAVTMVLGDPIPVPAPPTESGFKPAEADVDRLHQQYMEEIKKLFDKYKAAAGYGDRELEIR